MPARRLVLASASPARLGLLTQAGFAPDVVVSGVDEESFDADTLHGLVLGLAEAKAELVAALPEAAGAVVIGCDSLLDVDGEVHGKPVSIDHARLQLRRPELVNDLPGDARRLIQKVEGYIATVNAGQVTVAAGEDTGARPGVLLRGAR